MNLQHLQVAHAFQAQITAATSYLQPISDNQAAACVFATYDFPYHPQSAPSSRTSNTSSVLQTLRSLLSRGNQAPGPAVSYSSQLCLHSIALGLICSHIKYYIGILFLQQFLFNFQSRPPVKDRTPFLPTNFIRCGMKCPHVYSLCLCMCLCECVKVAEQIKKNTYTMCLCHHHDTCHPYLIGQYPTRFNQAHF